MKKEDQRIPVKPTLKRARLRSPRIRKQEALTRPLPSERISVNKQLEVLRGIAEASGPELKPASNADIAKFVNLHPNSVSLCNPFFKDNNFVERKGHHVVPSSDVCIFADMAGRRDPEALSKLAPLIRESWFGSKIMEQLTIRPISEEKAISLLSEASGAGKQHKEQLRSLLEYMEIVGLVVRHNGYIESMKRGTLSQRLGLRRAAGAVEQSDTPSHETPPVSTHPVIPEPSEHENFEIPIPGKSSASIKIPKNLDYADWKMLMTVLEAYVDRLKSVNNKGGTE